MKEFLQVLRRFVPPYKKYLALSVVFNILSAVLNIFSFAALIPILQILFQTGDTEAASGLMEWDWGNIQAVLKAGRAVVMPEIFHFFNYIAVEQILDYLVVFLRGLR